MIIDEYSVKKLRKHYDLQIEISNLACVPAIIHYTRANSKFTFELKIYVTTVRNEIIAHSDDKKLHYRAQK